MAQLDPSIILQAGRGVTPLKSQDEIADEQAQRQLRMLQLQQAQQGVADDQAYRGVLRSGATGADQVTALQRAGLGKQAMEAQKFQSDQERTRIERGKTIGEALKSGATAVMATPTEQNAINMIDGVINRLGVDGKVFDAGKARIYSARNDPAQIRQLMMELGAKAEEALGKIQSVDLGMTQQQQRVNPVTGQVEILGSQQKSATPSALLQAQTSTENSMRTDAREREFAGQRAQASRIPSGYRLGADGQTLEFIPGGPADPNSPKGKNTLTEGQSKALVFGARMQEAGAVLDKLEKEGKVLSTPGSRTGMGVGATINWVNSSEGQQLDQAKRDFINAVLRRESGAVIAESEFNNAEQQYFPQPGDSKAVIAQKKRNREVATRGILAEVPDSEARVAQVRGPAKPQGLSMAKSNTLESGKAVDTAAMEAELRRRGALK